MRAHGAHRRSCGCINAIKHLQTKEQNKEENNRMVVIMKTYINDPGRKLVCRWRFKMLKIS